MITQAAIKDVNGKIWTLPRPNRHGAVIRLIRDNKTEGITDSDALAKSVMGFIDENGKFYDRVEAKNHAMECKQPIYIYNPINPDDRFVDPHPETSEAKGLASEDLW